MENLRLGVSAVRHDMKREETVEEVEKNTELGRQTPKRNVVSSSLAGGATIQKSGAITDGSALFSVSKKSKWTFLTRCLTF